MRRYTHFAAGPPVQPQHPQLGGLESPPGDEDGRYDDGYDDGYDDDGGVGGRRAPEHAVPGERRARRLSYLIRSSEQHDPTLDRRVADRYAFLAAPEAPSAMYPIGGGGSGAGNGKGAGTASSRRRPSEVARVQQVLYEKGQALLLAAPNSPDARARSEAAAAKKAAEEAAAAAAAAAQRGGRLGSSASSTPKSRLVRGAIQMEVVAHDAKAARRALGEGAPHVLRYVGPKSDEFAEVAARLRLGLGGALDVLVDTGGSSSSSSSSSSSKAYRNGANGGSVGGGRVGRGRAPGGNTGGNTGGNIGGSGSVGSSSSSSSRVPKDIAEPRLLVAGVASNDARKAFAQRAAGRVVVDCWVRADQLGSSNALANIIARDGRLTFDPTAPDPLLTAGNGQQQQQQQQQQQGGGGGGGRRGGGGGGEDNSLALATRVPFGNRQRKQRQQTEWTAQQVRARQGIRLTHGEADPDILGGPSGRVLRLAGHANRTFLLCRVIVGGDAPVPASAGTAGSTIDRASNNPAQQPSSSSSSSSSSSFSSSSFSSSASPSSSSSEESAATGDLGGPSGAALWVPEAQLSMETSAKIGPVASLRQAPVGQDGRPRAPRTVFVLSETPQDAVGPWMSPPAAGEDEDGGSGVAGVAGAGTNKWQDQTYRVQVVAFDPADVLVTYATRLRPGADPGGQSSEIKAAQQAQKKKNNKNNKNKDKAGSGERKQPGGEYEDFGDDDDDDDDDDSDDDSDDDEDHALDEADLIRLQMRRWLRAEERTDQWGNLRPPHVSPGGAGAAGADGDGSQEEEEKASAVGSLQHRLQQAAAMARAANGGLAGRGGLDPALALDLNSGRRGGGRGVGGGGSGGGDDDGGDSQFRYRRERLNSLVGHVVTNRAQAAEALNNLGSGGSGGGGGGGGGSSSSSSSSSRQRGGGGGGESGDGPPKEPLWKRQQRMRKQADKQADKLGKVGTAWFAAERSRARQTLRRDKMRAEVDAEALERKLRALHGDVVDEDGGGGGGGGADGAIAATTVAATKAGHVAGMRGLQRNHGEVQDAVRKTLGGALAALEASRKERVLRLEARRVAIDQRLQDLRAIAKLRSSMTPEERPLHAHMFGFVAAADPSVSVGALGSTHEDDEEAMDPALLGFKIRNNLRLFDGTAPFPELPAEMMEEAVWPPNTSGRLDGGSRRMSQVQLRTSGAAAAAESAAAASALLTTFTTEDVVETALQQLERREQLAADIRGRALSAAVAKAAAGLKGGGRGIDDDSGDDSGADDDSDQVGSSNADGVVELPNAWEQQQLQRRQLQQQQEDEAAAAAGVGGLGSSDYSMVGDQRDWKRRGTYVVKTKTKKKGGGGGRGGSRKGFEGQVVVAVVNALSSRFFFIVVVAVMVVVVALPGFLPPTCISCVPRSCSLVSLFFSAHTHTHTHTPFSGTGARARWVGRTSCVA